MHIKLFVKEKYAEKKEKLNNVNTNKELTL